MDAIDLSADFDSEKYDQEMQSIFNQEYFGEQEFTKPDISSLLPPEFQDSDSETAGYQLREDLHCEDEGFNMDADYIDERPHKKGKTDQVL